MKEYLNNLSELDNDDGHFLKGERQYDVAPCLWIYSKLFPNNDVPSRLAYPISWGVPLTVLDFIEFELGYDKVWEDFDMDLKVGPRPFPKSIIFSNPNGYLIRIGTGWVNDTSNDQRALDLIRKIRGMGLPKESIISAKHGVRNKSDKKIDNTRMSESYLYVDDIEIFVPGPQKRNGKIFEKTIGQIHSYLSQHDTDPNKNDKLAKINMLVKEDYDMYFKDFDVSKFTPKLTQPDLFYGKGFDEYNQKLVSKLGNEKKGVVLFHGQPGTGKTHYIRYLLRELAELDKRVIYIPPSLVESMTDPVLISFLTNDIIDEERDTILLIEDAEPLLESREHEGGIRTTGISNLLNSTDGLLNDVLGLVVICTFNTELKNIDKALLRPGRLLARKEFKKIKKENLDKVAKIVKVPKDKIEKDTDYTIAELLNLNSEASILLHDHTPDDRKKIGFGVS